MGKDARKRAARGGSRWRTALHVVAQVGTGPFRGAQANPGGDVFDEKPVFKHAVLPSIPAIFAGASAWRRFSCRSGDAISRSAGSGVGHREGQGPKVLQHYGQSNEDRAGVQAAADGGPAGNPRPFGRIHPRKGRGGAASDHNSHRGSIQFHEGVGLDQQVGVVKFKSQKWHRSRGGRFAIVHPPSS